MLHHVHARTHAFTNAHIQYTHTKTYYFGKDACGLNLQIFHPPTDINTHACRQNAQMRARTRTRTCIQSLRENAHTCTIQLPDPSSVYMCMRMWECSSAKSVQLTQSSTHIHYMSLHYTTLHVYRRWLEININKSRNTEEEMIL